MLSGVLPESILLFIRIAGFEGIILFLGVGGDFLAGDNDSVCHRMNVFHALALLNLCLCILRDCKICKDIIAYSAVRKSEELLKHVGINEILFAIREFYSNVLTVNTGNYAEAECLMFNLKIYTDHRNLPRIIYLVNYI